MSRRVDSKWRKNLLPALAFCMATTGAMAEEDRFSTNYDNAREESGERVFIWNSEKVQGEEPTSVSGIEKDQGSVGLTLEGNSLKSTVQRLRETPEFQAFEGEIDNTTQELTGLNSLVDTLENHSVWELMEPVVGNWAITATTGMATWVPSTWTAKPFTTMLQTKDGSATKERMVEIYEKNVQTGEERLVDSYLQSATQYEFDRRTVSAGVNPENPNTNLDNRGWSEWTPVSDAYGHSEWLPRRGAIWQGMPFWQVQHYTVDYERYKWIYEHPPGVDKTFLGKYTMTSLSGDKVYAPNGQEIGEDNGCGSFICWGSSEHSDAPEFKENRRKLTGTKRLPRNGCYYDEGDSSTFERWGTRSGDYAKTQSKSNPRFYAKTTYSTNQYTGGDHILTQFYFDGVEIHRNEASSCSGLFCGGIGFGTPTIPVHLMETWFGSMSFESYGSSAPEPEYKLPIRTYRNYGSQSSSTTTDHKNSNVVQTRDLPFIWDGGRKKFYLGRKKTESVANHSGWYGSNNWKVYTRTYEVCMSNY